MNKELEFKNGKGIIKDELGNKIERKITPNIEEVLITENNIEEIEKLITDNKSIVDFNKSYMRLSKFLFGVSALWGVTFISNLLAGNIFSAVCNILCSILWSCNAYFLHIKPNLPKLKAAKKSVFLLENELNIEKEKLDKLEKEKEIDCMYIDTSKKYFTTSDKILELKDKLRIIKDYQCNKTKYIKYYNEGILNILMYHYNNDNLIFLEELIKNDLNNNKSKTKEKQKTLVK